MAINNKINTAKYEKQKENKIFINVMGIDLSKKNKTIFVKNKKITPPTPLNRKCSIFCIISP